MRFWIQLDSDNIIRDCIEYEHDGYVPVELELPLPVGLTAGYSRWVTDHAEVDEVLKAEIEKQNRPPGYEELASKLDLIQKAMDDMILGGAL